MNNIQIAREERIQTLLQGKRRKKETQQKSSELNQLCVVSNKQQLNLSVSETQKLLMDIPTDLLLFLLQTRYKYNTDVETEEKLSLNFHTSVRVKGNICQTVNRSDWVSYRNGQSIGHCYARLKSAFKVAFWVVNDEISRPTAERTATEDLVLLQHHKIVSRVALWEETYLEKQKEFFLLSLSKLCQRLEVAPDPNNPDINFYIVEQRFKSIVDWQSLLRPLREKHINLLNGKAIGLQPASDSSEEESDEGEFNNFPLEWVVTSNANDNKLIERQQRNVSF